MKISIVIPVFNTEKYIKRCIESVLKQDFLDDESNEIEIICVNDGSTDNSAEILDYYDREYNNILTYSQENQGLSAARNTGLEHVSGNYVLFLDSDDCLPTYALRVLYKVANHYNADITCSTKFSKFSDKIVPIEIPENELVYSKKFTSKLKDFVKNKKIYSTACNKLYKTNLIKTERFIPGIYFEDWPLNLRIFSKANSYATTNISCYNYFQANESLTRSNFTQKKVNSYIIGIKSSYDYFQSKPDLKYAQKRMAIALKMLVSKVYKTPELYEYALTKINSLLSNKVLLSKHISLKTKLRLFKIKRSIKKWKQQ
ncbi:MAG: glycosyltransferase [Alphaproteobacteria bacterium]|nr:glycosyltransferase [Alphaproteobacteria bacterium]